MYVLWSVCGWVVDNPFGSKRKNQALLFERSRVVRNPDSLKKPIPGGCLYQMQPELRVPFHEMLTFAGYEILIDRLRIPRIHGSMVSGILGVCGVGFCISCEQENSQHWVAMWQCSGFLRDT